jgi:hypothetical protein
VRPGASARRVARHAARHAARRRLLSLAQARCRLLRGSSRVRVPRHVTWLVTWIVAQSRRRLLRLTQARRRQLCLAQARRRLLRIRHVSGCLGTSRGSLRGSSRGSSLVVDYFAYAARLGASTRRAAHRMARFAARRRLLRVRRASGCLGTSRGSSHGSSCSSSSTTSPTPRIWVPRHVARLIACCRLLRLCRATGCLGMSLGSSRGSLRHSSSTTSLTPRVQVPRHVAWPVTRLIVDYSVRRDFVLRPRWLYFSHVVHRDYLSRATLALLRVHRALPRRRLPIASRRPFILTSFPN